MIAPPFKLPIGWLTFAIIGTLPTTGTIAV